MLRNARALAPLLIGAALAVHASLPAAEPEAYAIADALFLQRDNQSTDQPLAASAGSPILTTRQLQFPTQPGLRLFYGSVNDDDAGWEVGYLGVWNMFASRSAGGPDDVQAQDPLALLVPEFNGRGLARATYATTLNSIETNVFTRADDGGYRRDAAEPWRRCAGYCRSTFDWLAGFRWAGLDESAGLTLTGGGNPLPGVYSLRSSTNLFGGQLGGRGRMEWERWAFEGWAKAALCGTALSQSQDPIVDAAVPDPPIRPAQSSTEGGVGFIGDINATLVYRLTETGACGPATTSSGCQAWRWRPISSISARRAPAAAASTAAPGCFSTVPASASRPAGSGSTNARRSLTVVPGCREARIVR